MKKQILTTFFASIAMAGTMAQTGSVPRLVVGISIDQLRSDYLNAFMPLYGDGGFKLLLEKGQVYSNVQYQHTPVDRASAIASVVTGTIPYNHGIIAEEWMSRTELHTNYCVDDRNHKGVGTSDNSSPKHLLVSTIGDELKAATKGKALVYSVAPYREVAILGAGHAADWAMWIDNQSGKWAGTTYYGEAPSWFRYLDGGSIADRISSLTWNPKNDVVGTYNYYLTTPQKSFSHRFTGDSRFRVFKTSGLVNEEVTKAARSCIENGHAGMDEVTDFLSICYYAGNFHADNTISTTTELQDTYIRLDNELATLLNAKAPQLLAEEMAAVGGRMIHVSTDYVFDGTAHVPYKEDAATAPVTVYGRTKLAGEEAVMQACPASTIVRTAWLYSTFGNNFVKTMLRLGAEREELGVIFDQIGTPTYARDLAQALLRIAESEPHPGIYHFSNEGVCSWYDFTREIHRLAGITSCRVRPLHTEEYPTPAQRPHYSVLDKTKIKQTFGVSIPWWADSLRECIEKLMSDM